MENDKLCIDARTGLLRASAGLLVIWGILPGAGNTGKQMCIRDRYDTSRWKEGRGVFAAPESAGAGGAGVVLQAETPEHGEAGTYFFRKEFELDGIDEILSMEGQIRYSDAVIVYLNGEIIFAGNVPAGGYESNQETGTAQASEGVQESYFQVTDLSALRAGRNILAVEVHQEDMEQNDAYFSFQGFRLLGIELEEDEPDIRGLMPVSYTHLDVYKRQGRGSGEGKREEYD